MATEFKKLSEVTTLEEAAETAHVLIEENGEIYRVPKTAVGGSNVGGIKTAIIRDSGYLNTIAGLSTMAISGGPKFTYECINMTFEEAYETMAKGEPLNIVGMLSNNVAANMQGSVIFAGATRFGVPCLVVEFEKNTLFWTADGLSTSEPSSGR